MELLSRIVGMAALVLIPATGLTVPLYLIIRSVINFRRDRRGRGFVVFKAVLSLIAWLLTSKAMLFMMFVTFYSAAHAEDRHAADRGVLLALVFFIVVYALIGFGLALWVRHRGDSEPVKLGLS